MWANFYQWDLSQSRLIVQLIDLIKSLTLIIEKLKNKSDFYQTKWYGIEGGFTSKLDIMEPKVITPRICSKQIYCQNPQLEPIRGYFHAPQ